MLLGNHVVLRLLSNHVEIDHASNVDGVILVRLCQVFRTKEALLLTGKGSKGDRCLRLVVRKDSCQF